MNTRDTAQQGKRSRLAGLRGLGRGLALTSAVAMVGVGGLSAADASAAGVAQGVRHVNAATAVPDVSTSGGATGTTQIVVRQVTRRAPMTSE